MTPKNRRLLSLSLLAAMLLALLGAGAVLMQRQARLRGALDGMPDANLPYRVPVLGINADLTQYDDAALVENLDLMAEVGFVWVRQPFRWSEVEPQAGTYDWSTYDGIVEAAAARDLRIVAVLVDSPGWAADSPTAPPDDLAAFEAFASALAERYGEHIDVYQVWDEPNLSSGWGGQAPSPVEYAALLEAAYGAIHAADDTAAVLTAGLAPTVEQGPENISDVTYLRELYQNGAGQFFDGVMGKPYGFDDGPDEHQVHENVLNFSRLVLLREVMVENGDAVKPLWASHFGWNALPEGWEGQPSAWGQTSAEQQAEWTLTAYRRALTEWPWSGALILDNWQPSGGDDDPRWGFALRRQDGTLSPTAEALQSVSAEINSSLWPGIYPALTPLADYSGEWEFSELGADIIEGASSAIDVPFTGDSAGVIARRDEYRAYLYVTVDGQPPDLLPRDERGAYAVLTSPDYQPHVEVMPLADGLDSDISHNLRIEPERGWDQWAIAGFAVGHNIVTWPYDAAVAALLVLAAGCAVMGFRTGRGLNWRESFDGFTARLIERLDEGLHLLLAGVSALAVWAGMALTWGGLVPELTRRMGEVPSLLLTALTAGIFYYSPWLLLTLAALALLFVLIYAKPATGVALMMFFAPYYLLPRPLFDRAFSMVEVIALLTAAAWAIRITAGFKETGWPTLRSVWARMNALDKAVGLFIAVCFVSLAWSELLGVAVTELRQMVLEPFAAYLVLRTLPFTDRERWRVIDLLVLTGVVVSLIGLYQFVAGINVIAAEAGMPRLISIFGTPNNAALFLGRVVPLGAAVLLIDRGGWRRWLYGAGAGIMSAALILTLSKGGILLGLPAGVAMVVILWAGKAGLIAVGAGVILEVLALIPLSRLPRFSGLIDFSSGTSTSFFRVQLWKSTLRLLRDHPITGVGLDQFLYQYRGHYILPSAWQQPELSQPHNFLLNYWVRLGIVGLAAGIWLQVAFWRLGWRVQKALREVGDVKMRALAVGLMGSMAAMVAHGLVDAVHFVIDLAFIFFMTLGMMQQLGEGADDGYNDQRANIKAG